MNVHADQLGAFFFLWAHCGILVPLSGIKPISVKLGAWGLDCQESPWGSLFNAIHWDLLGIGRVQAAKAP